MKVFSSFVVRCVPHLTSSSVRARRATPRSSQRPSYRRRSLHARSRPVPAHAACSPDETRAPAPARSASRRGGPRRRASRGGWPAPLPAAPRRPRFLLTEQRDAEAGQRPAKDLRVDTVLAKEVRRAPVGDLGLGVAPEQVEHLAFVDPDIRDTRVLVPQHTFHVFAGLNVGQQRLVEPARRQRQSPCSLPTEWSADRPGRAAAGDRDRAIGGVECAIVARSVSASMPSAWASMASARVSRPAGRRLRWATNSHSLRAPPGQPVDCKWRDQRGRTARRSRRCGWRWPPICLLEPLQASRVVAAVVAELGRRVQRLGQQRLVADRAGLSDERSAFGRARAHWPESRSAISRRDLDRSSSTRLRVAGSSGGLTTARSERDVGAAFQGRQRRRRADGVLHHLAVGGREHVAEGAHVAQALPQARHPQVQHLRGLLAAHVRRLAGLGVHPCPARDVLINSRGDTREGLLGVALARAANARRMATLRSLVPGARLPDAGEVLGAAGAHRARVARPAAV